MSFLMHTHGPAMHGMASVASSPDEAYRTWSLMQKPSKFGGTIRR